MKLSEIKKIKHCYKEDEINKALKEGYVTFKVAQIRLKTPEFEETRIQYCMGKK